MHDNFNSRDRVWEYPKDERTPSEKDGQELMTRRQKTRATCQAGTWREEPGHRAGELGQKEGGVQGVVSWEKGHVWSMIMDKHWIDRFWESHLPLSAPTSLSFLQKIPQWSSLLSLNEAELAADSQQLNWMTNQPSHFLGAQWMTQIHRCLLWLHWWYSSLICYSRFQGQILLRIFLFLRWTQQR